jgi:hypothetical protein
MTVRVGERSADDVRYIDVRANHLCHACRGWGDQEGVWGEHGAGTGGTCGHARRERALLASSPEC